MTHTLQRSTQQTTIATEQTRLLRLLQLVSPGLPVGAYAYSQGLESAVNNGWVTDEKSASAWIFDLLENALYRTDIPVIAKLYPAWTNSDLDQVKYWNRFLFACRESSELQNEDHQLGRALTRLLSDMDMQHASAWRNENRICFATLFTLAATQWHISLTNTCLGYLWAWVENQIVAAIKLIPLGQTAGQKILSRAIEKIPAIVEQSLNLSDDDIGFATPGLAIASAHHETQYSRLFRS